MRKLEAGEGGARSVHVVAMILFVFVGCGGVAPLAIARDGEASDGAPSHDGEPVVNDGGDARGDDASTGAKAGAACGVAGECASGFCADGVCCESACQGGCVACNQPGRVGTCWPIDDGQRDPRGVCVDEGAKSCGLTGRCDGFGACAKYAAGTICAASTCVGNAFEGARACDGRGTCGAAPPSQACAPYACNPANCLNACISDLGCAAPAVCVSGQCRALPSLVLADAAASGELGGAYAEPFVDDACPAGSAVVGYDVATTGDPSFDVVDRVRTICGALRVGHARGLTIDVADLTPLAERGVGSGAVTKLRCPANQVVAGFDGRAGAFVDQIGFRCAPLLVAGAGDAVALGAVAEIGPVGGSGGEARGAVDCGPAEVAVGTRTLADLVVKKIALLCATVGLR